MDYIKEFEELLSNSTKEANEASTLEELANVRIKYLSKKGLISVMMNKIREVEDKKAFGEAFKNCKDSLEAILNSKQEVFQKAKINEELLKEKIDITLNGRDFHEGNINPFFKIIREIEDIFIGMGYTIEDGPEVEKDHYNFELLNIPSDHPARDMQDSFYIDETTLLRTHTSPVQARVMEKNQNKPVKIICPGKVFRRDDDDMTHSHQFAQVECLVIDKNINMGNLKATLELFVKKMFGEKREIRLRSSYFPFTEPSVEVDISCMNCNGKGCSMCKGTGWIEILGAGMVNPKVLEMSGYDSNVYSGFAFGIGIERVAMLRYGIDDIRRFYQNDIRFLNSFVKKVED